MPRESDLTGVIMEGIQFLTNDKGERVAVQIDLRKHIETRKLQVSPGTERSANGFHSLLQRYDGKAVQVNLQGPSPRCLD